MISSMLGSIGVWGPPAVLPLTLLVFHVNTYTIYVYTYIYTYIHTHYCYATFGITSMFNARRDEAHLRKHAGLPGAAAVRFFCSASGFSNSVFNFSGPWEGSLTITEYNLVTRGLCSFLKVTWDITLFLFSCWGTVGLGAANCCAAGKIKCYLHLMIP